MLTTITVTQLIKDVNSVKKFTDKGLSVQVNSGKKPIFIINPIKISKTKKVTLPSYKIEFEDNLSKEQLHDKYISR